MKRITQRPFLFHPATVLVASILAAGLFAVFIHLLFDGDLRWFLLYYFVPIGIPFVAFLVERAEQHGSISVVSWLIEAWS